VLSKPIDQINKDDIEELVESQRPESNELDYKRALPPKDQITEFLKDVASMANASGGHLIYGISEKENKSDRTYGYPIYSQASIIG